ncbi:MAG: hypothetical protein IJX95_06610 [Lachnospiraceae bacterium]|nr:hypothetical protein [Lachnospiraceae bacterium]
MRREELKQKLGQDEFRPMFETLYGTKAEVLSAQRARYEKAVERFEELYPEREDIYL